MPAENHASISVSGDEPRPAPVYSLWQLTLYMLRLGTIGFGGPVVITTGFIGFLIGGAPGAVIAAVATFLPCYFFTIIPAPYFRKHGKRPSIAAFINGVTAAAIGAICGAVVVLGRKTLLGSDGTPDFFKIGLFAVTVVLLWRFKKLPEPLVVVAAALLGLVCQPLSSH